VHLGEGFPLNGGMKKGYPIKFAYFTAIGSYSKRLQKGTDMLLIATSTGDELHKNVNNDDLK